MSQSGRMRRDNLACSPNGKPCYRRCIKWIATLAFGSGSASSACLPEFAKVLTYRNRMSLIAKIYVSAIVVIGSAVSSRRVSSLAIAGSDPLPLLPGAGYHGFAPESIAARHQRRAVRAVYFHSVRHCGTVAARSAVHRMRGHSDAMLVELPAAAQVASSVLQSRQHGDHGGRIAGRFITPIC